MNKFLKKSCRIDPNIIHTKQNIPLEEGWPASYRLNYKSQWLLCNATLGVDKRELIRMFYTYINISFNFKERLLKLNKLMMDNNLKVVHRQIFCRVISEESDDAEYTYLKSNSPEIPVQYNQIQLLSDVIVILYLDGIYGKESDMATAMHQRLMMYALAKQILVSLTSIPFYDTPLHDLISDTIHAIIMCSIRHIIVDDKLRETRPLSLLLLADNSTQRGEIYRIMVQLYKLHG